MSLPPSPQIGRTTLIGVRDAVGGNEDTHFTPWLARNIDVLGELLGVQLRVLEPGEEDLAFGRHIEVPVGGFYLDIRAVDSLGRTVAIENQYGAADHKHLGQVITYAAGVGADALVWIAESFTEAHLDAVRWLNRRTDEECGVFAVKAAFVKIGDSLPAPVFEVLVKPADWVKAELPADRQVWTIESFLQECDAQDRSKVTRVLDLAMKSLPNGAVSAFWFGARPNGSIYVKPEGRRYAPFYMWINSKKRAMVTGAWANYVTVANHPGFGPVAEFLGQDHLAKGATGRPLADLEVEGFWEAAMSSSRQINTTPANPERDPDSWQNSAGAL